MNCKDLSPNAKVVSTEFFFLKLNSEASFFENKLFTMSETFFKYVFCVFS